MNLRTLKKLSKRAAPLLAALGDTRGQFRADGEACLGRLIVARKHWDRRPCHPSYEPRNDYTDRRGLAIKHTTRAGRTIVIQPPWSPRRGTVMVGAMSGYYEPEWDEETAWEALTRMLHFEFTDWTDAGPRPLRQLRSPTDFFVAAAELLNSRSRPTPHKDQQP